MDNNTRTQAALPTPMIDDIKSRSFGTFGVDNAVLDLLGEIGFLAIFSQYGWSKRSGKDLPSLIVLLIIHPLLKATSIHIFCRDHFHSVFAVGKDAFYRLLQRSFPWRTAHWALVKRLLPQWKTLDLGEGYLVTDTTIKEKRGSRIEGVASLKFVKEIHALGLVPLIRWKRNKVKFHYQGGEFTTTELWSRFARAKARKAKGSKRFKGTFLDVENSEIGPVRLFFVRLIDPEKGSKEWAIFLTTDRTMSLMAMIEHYANRWGIEVFYKESKQHLGFLSESVRSFEAVTACLHLAAMRHAILSSVVVLKGVNRERLSHELAAMTYAKKLWNTFRCLITSALNKATNLGNDLKNEVIELIDQEIEAWLAQVLLLDPVGLQRQKFAEMNCES